MLQCPPDGAAETIDHTLSTCRFLLVAFNTISKCFLPLSIDGATVSSVQDLMSLYLDTTFEVPAGIMAWLAIMVNWECRCMASTKVPTWHQFMHLWISSLTTWTKLPHPPIPVNDILLFAKSISLLLNEGKLVHPNLNPAPPTPPFRKPNEDSKTNSTEPFVTLQNSKPSSVSLRTGGFTLFMLMDLQKRLPKLAM